MFKCNTNCGIKSLSRPYFKFSDTLEDNWPTLDIYFGNKTFKITFYINSYKT